MLSTYIHTQAPAQATIVTIHNLMYSQLKEVAIRNLRRMKIAARNGKYDRSIVFEKEMSWDLI